MMVRSIVAGLLLLALSGCDRTEKVVAPEPIPVSSFSGIRYNVLVKNADESIIVLGHLRFSEVRDCAIAGTWELNPWGAGSSIPGLPGQGAFSGTYLAGTAVLQLDLAGTGSSLGMFFEGMVGERMTGRTTLLPSGAFEGRFEAIATAMP